MNTGSYFSVAGSLAFVLMLMGAALAFLRRFQVGGSRNAAAPLNVLQRVTLGPKHAVATVRVGERVIVVSTSEAGVNMLLELSAEESALALAPSAIARVSAVNAAPRPKFVLPGFPELDVARVARLAPVPSPSFHPFMRAVLQRCGVPVVFALMLFVSHAASAQVPDSLPPRAPAPVVAAPVAAPVTAPAQLPAAKDSTVTTPASAVTAQGTTAPDTATKKPAATTAKAKNEAPRFDLRVGGAKKADALRLSGPVGTVIMMGALTLLPTLVLMMTGFTRILIVLHFLRQAIGTQSAPPSQLIGAFAILLTCFVMAPTLARVNGNALQPWLNGQIEQSEMIDRASVPFREFMVRQTRDKDISTFVAMSSGPAPATVNDVPMPVLAAAFVTSELRTAFQIGFVLFLPFVIIDTVVAAVLMSMGMVMLPPAMISLPFKLLLFVLVDGWTLVVQGLVQSFH